MDRFLRAEAVKRATGLGRSTIYDLMAENPPRFPRPVKLNDGGRAVAWLGSEIAKWQEERIAQRDAKLATCEDETFVNVHSQTDGSPQRDVRRGSAEFGHQCKGRLSAGANRSSHQGAVAQSHEAGSEPHSGSSSSHRSSDSRGRD
jgi:predicted DNA-binding transcriptional regulator AlpA